MNGNKIIVLRRLKTRDGIVSDIQELKEYRRKEHRAIAPKLSAIWSERETADCSYRPVESREYVETNRYQAILIEMEEV